MDIDKLVEGIGKFQKKDFSKHKNEYINLVKNGQNPKALFIGCSDSRVAPNIITNSKAGDLFMHRNVGNFVSPFGSDVGTEIASTIEYAVNELNLSNIIVCGHSHCGAIHALNHIESLDSNNMPNLIQWLKNGNRVKEIVENISIKKQLNQEEKLKYMEKISVIFSLQNLLTYPYVCEKVIQGSLKIVGWYYTIETGEIEQFNEEDSRFYAIDA